MSNALRNRLRRLEERLGVSECLCGDRLQLRVTIFWQDFSRVDGYRLRRSLEQYEARPTQCPTHATPIPGRSVALRSAARHEPAAAYYQRMAEHLAQRVAA